MDKIDKIRYVPKLYGLITDKLDKDSELSADNGLTKTVVQCFNDINQEKEELDVQHVSSLWFNALEINPRALSKFMSTLINTGNLTQLRLNNISIDNIEWLPTLDLSNLYILSLSHNHITNIQPLVKTHFSKVKYIVTHNNKILDYEPIARLYSNEKSDICFMLWGAVVKKMIS